jgi:hypothetical protein
VKEKDKRDKNLTLFHQLLRRSLEKNPLNINSLTLNEFFLCLSLHFFLSACLLPSTHVTEVDKDLATAVGLTATATTTTAK